MDEQTDSEDLAGVEIYPSDQYYCGLCGCMMPISHFPHGS